MARSKLDVWSIFLILVAYFFVGIHFILHQFTFYPSYPYGAFFISLGAIIGIFAFILGIISLIKIRKEKLERKWIAIATIILSLILIVGRLLYWI